MNRYIALLAGILLLGAGCATATIDTPTDTSVDIEQNVTSQQYQHSAEVIDQEIVWTMSKDTLSLTKAKGYAIRQADAGGFSFIMIEHPDNADDNLNIGVYLPWTWDENNQPIPFDEWFETWNEERDLNPTPVTTRTIGGIEFAGYASNDPDDDFVTYIAIVNKEANRIVAVPVSSNASTEVQMMIDSLNFSPAK